jgi:hypothetical protein
MVALQARGRRDRFLHLAARLKPLVHAHQVDDHRKEHERHRDPNSPVSVSAPPKGRIRTLLLLRLGKVMSVMPSLLLALAHPFALQGIENQAVGWPFATERQANQ